MGVLAFQFLGAEMAKAWVHSYYNAITKRLDKLTEYEINPQIAVVSPFMCCETDEEALEKADGSTFFQFSLLFYNRIAVVGRVFTARTAAIGQGPGPLRPPLGADLDFDGHEQLGHVVGVRVPPLMSLVQVAVGVVRVVLQ